MKASVNYREKESVSVVIHDARKSVESGQLDFMKNGFTLVRQKGCSVLSKKWEPSAAVAQSLSEQAKKTLKEEKMAGTQTDQYALSKHGVHYYTEIEQLIKDTIGADKVIAFASQRRSVAEATRKGKANAFAGTKVNGYASVVHTDFASSKAVEKIFQTNGVPSCVKLRTVLVNAWRSTDEDSPIRNNALALCDSTSVRVPDDLIPCSVPLDGHDFAEQYRLAPSDKHRWYYFPDMKFNEVLLFKQYDTEIDKTRFCFHTSFQNPNAPSQPARQSIEVRAMAFFLELTEEAASWTPEARAKVKQAAISTLHLTGKTKTSMTDEFTQLKMHLERGAAKKLIKKADVPSIIDKAALDGVDLNDIEATLKHICKEGKIKYNSSDWGFLKSEQKDGTESKKECTDGDTVVPKDIAEAKLKAALVVINKIDKSFTNIKCMLNNAPKSMTLTLDAIYILIKGKKPDKSGKASVALEQKTLFLVVSGPRFFKKQIDEFDKDKVTTKTLKLLQPILDDPNFKPENVKKAMACLHGPCLWVRAVHEYCTAKNLEKSFA